MGEPLKSDPTTIAAAFEAQARLCVGARVLRLLARFGTDDRPGPIGAKITPEIFAEMIGTTRRGVNHFMNKFQQPGLIEDNAILKARTPLLSAVLNGPSSISVSCPTSPIPSF